MALLGVGWQSGSSYRLFPAKTSTVGLFPSQFCFSSYISTPQIVLCWLLSRFQSGKLFQGYNPVLRVLIFFVVSGDFEGGSEVVSDSSDRSSDVFQKGDQDLSENLLDVSARAEFFFPF